MVHKIIKFLGREIDGLHEAAYLLGIFAVASTILGLVRDRLLAHIFGAGSVLDLYYASFRVPDIVFATVASLVSASALIPFIVQKMQTSNELAKNFINKIFTIFCLLILVIGEIVFLLMPYILDGVFPNLMATSSDELVLMSRVLLLSPLLLGVSNLLGSIVQARRRFAVFALAPVVYNIGIIIGVIFLQPIYGIMGVVMGVILGAFFHASIQLPSVIHSGFTPRLALSGKMKEWGDAINAIKVSVPRTIALSLGQVTNLFMVSIATFMAIGSVAVFSMSMNLQSVPMAIIGVSYSLAAFPTLSSLFHNGEKEKFLISIQTAIRHVIFWSMPVIAIFVVVRAQIVRTVLGSGAFDWDDTRLTAACLAIFAISVLAQNIILLLVRGYYASGKTYRPLMINVLSAIIMVIGSYALRDVFFSGVKIREFFEILFKVKGIPGTEVLALPLAFSLASIFNVVVLLSMFVRDFGGKWDKVRKSFFQGLLAMFTVGVVSYFFLNIFDEVFDLETLAGIFFQGLFSGVAGLFAGIIVLIAIGNEEIMETYHSLTKKIFRIKPVAPEQTEL